MNQGREIRRRTRSSFLCSVLFALCTPCAADDADWVDSRSQHDSVLIEISDDNSSATDSSRVRALLALADRSINRSVADATQFLERAESLIDQDYVAEHVALAIRCQLEHRQTLPAAEKTCTRLNNLQFASEGLFVRAFVHVTRMYYYYREGQHQRSVQEAELALDCATPIHDAALLAAAHNTIGLHFSTRLKPRISLPHFESALEHANHLSYPEPRTISQINLASSYTYLGRAKESLQILNEVRESPVVNLYATRRLVIQSMIGHAQAVTGDTERAEEDLLQVMEEVSNAVLPDGMTFGYISLGLIQLAKNKPEDALKSFDKVLEITGRDFDNDIDYSRIQLVAVPYASALRESGRVEQSRDLLLTLIENAKEEPDQILVDAYRSLALTLKSAGDLDGAQRASENVVKVESDLWDASLQYQVARLSSFIETQRNRLELERSREREADLRATAERESRLRRQSWLMAFMMMLMIAMYFSRRLQKRIADTERAASAKLEQQVRKRTCELEKEMDKRSIAEIERRQLTEKMHEGEKLRAMGKITAGVAHDFNNLMTVVMLGADDLKTRLVHTRNDTASETLSQIHRAADTGAKITQGLLAYVRKQPLQAELVQLDELLQSALPMFRNTLGERHSLAFSVEKCLVLVDKGQLVTALLNLLLNAKEAMSHGGPISLTLRNLDGQAKIEVRDIGRGMSESVVKQAVDPFFTTKENEDGSGLGLSMVYGFVRQSNGDIQLESQPNEGTTVTLSLPLASADSAQKEALGPETYVIPQGTRILAVEDQPKILQILARTLTKLGAIVKTASSADEALDVIKRTGLPDILITDVVMPGELDGLDLVSRVKDMNPDQPIVLMSGYAKEIDHECTFLRKPFSSAELQTAIEVTLSRRTLSEVADESL